jgi:hypothetical protein
MDGLLRLADDFKFCREQLSAYKKRVLERDGTIRELRAQVEALQPDAERYRWLKRQEKATAWFDGGVCVTLYPVYPKEQALDAAIDALREGE